MIKFLHDFEVLVSDVFLSIFMFVLNNVFFSDFYDLLP